MKKLQFALTLFLLGSILSCGSLGSSAGGKESVTEKLRIVHAAPSLGAITILQDEKPINSALSYGKATEYIELDETTEAVFSIRVTPEFVLPILAVKEAIVGPYKKTLLVTESAGQPVLTFIADQTATKIPGDESRLRFVNAASAAKTIDVYVTSPTTPLKGRSPIVSKLAFLATSSYFATSPGEYRIRIVADSTTTTETPEPDFDLNTFLVDSGEEITFLLLESKGGGKPYESLTLSAIGD